MNPFRLILLPLLATLLLLTGSISGQAQSNEDSASALTAAKNWLKLIDAGLYADSYDTCCEATQQRVPKDKWVIVLRSLRSSWGTVTSRQLSNQVSQPNGIFNLSGNCMVITFDTSFKKLPDAQEMIVLRQENGRWFGAGYRAGPKPNEGAPIQVPQTELDTRDNVKL